MSDIKLTYFNATGVAETSRLILAHAGEILVDLLMNVSMIISGVRYTDQRLTSDQFAGVKTKLPYGQLPIAKMDGEFIAQSSAIAR